MVLKRKPMLLKNLAVYGTNGSKGGMQFVIQKEGDVMAAYTFPAPFAFDYTAPKYKTRQEFAWDDEGYDAAIEWINNQYEERLSEWELAEKAGISGAVTHI
ncbi:MAG TPA: hypothetical protein IAB23_01040 [Candidatus Scybalocola faecavium]|nr:hypothetical protein [Candidatus Scybalocola faecavium]